MFSSFFVEKICHYVKEIADKIGWQTLQTEAETRTALIESPKQGTLATIVTWSMDTGYDFLLTIWNALSNAIAYIYGNELFGAQIGFEETPEHLRNALIQIPKQVESIEFIVFGLGSLVACLMVWLIYRVNLLTPKEKLIFKDEFPRMLELFSHPYDGFAELEDIEEKGDEEPIEDTHEINEASSSETTNSVSDTESDTSSRSFGWMFSSLAVDGGKEEN